MVKAQSAIEYLTTYGWMLMAVAITLPVIYSVVGGQCNSTATGFEATALNMNDFGLGSENLSMLLENRKSHQISIEEVSLVSRQQSRIVSVSEDLPPGRTSVVDLPGFKASSECNTFDIEIKYSEKGLTGQYITGSLTLNAELQEQLFAVALANGSKGSFRAEPGQTIRFDASDSSDPEGQALNYNWALDDGTTSTSETFQHIYSSAGIYNVVLNVTNQDGNFSTDTLEINVSSSAPPPNTVAKAHNETGIFEYSYLEAYEGENITFNASESYDPNGNSLTSFEWDLDNGDILTGQTATYTQGFNATPGEYDITLTVTNNQSVEGTDQLTLNVTTTEPAAPSNLQFE